MLNTPLSCMMSFRRLSSSSSRFSLSCSCRSSMRRCSLSISCRTLVMACSLLSMDCSRGSMSRFRCTVRCRSLCKHSYSRAMRDSMSAMRAACWEARMERLWAADC